MANTNIKNKQIEYLEGSKENIDFKVFDYDGTYLQTETQNVAKKCPEKIIPKGKDLVKLLDKPLKRVNIKTNLNRLSIQNENAHFLHSSLNDRFILATPGSGLINQIQTDATENVKALSGNRYFVSTNLDQSGTNLATISLNQEHNKIKQRKKLTVVFNYYIATTDSTDQFFLNLKASLDESYSSSSELKHYNFEEQKWENFPSSSSDQSVKENQTSTVNAWGKISVDIEPYSSSSVDSDVFMTISINKIRRVGLGTGGFSKLFIDNFYIAESYELEGDKIVSTREQITNNGNYTAEYDHDDLILSNEADDTDFFIGKIEGDFKRERDSVGKKLEQCISAEMINDSRNYLTRYEGTFRDNALFADDPISLYNKIHLDFGNNVYQDFQSCYLDTLKFKVKSAEAVISMHVANQDCDTGTTYVTQFE